VDEEQERRRTQSGNFFTRVLSPIKSKSSTGSASSSPTKAEAKEAKKAAKEAAVVAQQGVRGVINRSVARVSSGVSCVVHAPGNALCYLNTKRRQRGLTGPVSILVLVIILAGLGYLLYGVVNGFLLNESGEYSYSYY